MYSESRSQKKNNEDVIFASDTLWIVADAASGLTKSDYMQQGSDAAWFSNFLVSSIAKQIETKDQAVASSDHSDDLKNSDLSLSQILANACKQAADLFPACSELEMPSAAIAILYKNKAKNQFEYLVLGDCVLLLETDTVTKITDPTIAAFDQLALDFMAKSSQEKHQPFLDQRPLANAILIENRKKKNQPGGYFIVDCSTRWLGHELVGTVPLDALKRAALYSDGFDQLQSFLEADSFLLAASNQDEKMHTEADAKGNTDPAFLDYIFANQDSVLDQLYDLQEQDATCTILPRFKLRDDTSLILVDFKNK